MKKIVAVALAVLLSHSVAFAGVVTDVINVTAQISTGAGECTVVADNPIDFGTWDGSYPLGGAGSFSLECPAGLPYTVSLDAGQNYDGAYRALLDPATGGMIAYVLFKTDYSEWGDDGITHHAPSITSVGQGFIEVYPVSGEANASLYGIPPDGIYSDVVTITVNY